MLLECIMQFDSNSISLRMARVCVCAYTERGREQKVEITEKDR